METASCLIGRSVTIRANDFVDMPTSGCIKYADVETNTMVIELDVPLRVGNLQYDWVVASPRLARDDMDTLINVGVLGCGITWIPNERFNPNAPFDLSWWRGGAAAISDIVLSGK
jgi:hypothetical protein